MKQPRRANADDDVTNRRPFESQAESTGVAALPARGQPAGRRLDDGTFLVQNQFLSADPAMRGWITYSNDYLPRVQSAIRCAPSPPGWSSSPAMRCTPSATRLWGRLGGRNSAPSARCAEGLDMAHRASGSPSGLTRLFGWLAVSWCVTGAAVGSPAAAVAVAQPGSCPDTQIVFGCGTNEALPAFGGQRKVKL